MAQKDYYDILGVAKNADDKQIKKAYKRLAMKHHPDRNADDKSFAEKKFKQIQKAYAILSEPEKRQAYDQFGHAGVDGNAGGGFGSNPFGGGGGGGFGDIFGDIFGGGQRQQEMRGADLRYDLEIDLKAAVEGT
ncbi:MAG: DnaJ domain-containing protein, partial [Candidatus Thioglobus sp.]|nr:DnaJ domain-containing protein [Candidatus Thioglobus sp.]